MNTQLQDARGWWNSLITEEQTYKKALMLKAYGVTEFDKINLTEATDEEVIRLWERNLSHEDKIQSLLLHYENDENLMANIENMQLSKEHPKYKAGQIIEFTGGYYNQFRYRTRISGFDKDNDIYIVWDSYWFPIRDEKERDIKIID